MKTIEFPTTPLTDEERLRCAQEAYREYSCRCFWFMDENLIVTEKNLHLIIEGLKLHGGHKGWKLAHALCR
jgi:hypothetical protein